MAAGDDARFHEAGRLIFAGEADFKWAADKFESLPPIGDIEIAFAGRSNVGKSSLVNALTGRNALARTSHTPGRTQLLNFFDIGGHFTLVDMPGYGYAAVSKAKVEAWTKTIRAYLRGRPTLARVFVLIDARHGIKPIDETLFALLDETAVSYALVLTKADEVKQADLPARIEATQAAIARRPAAYPQVFLTSSHAGLGIPELRASVARLLAERDGGR